MIVMLAELEGGSLSVVRVFESSGTNKIKITARGEAKSSKRGFSIISPFYHYKIYSSFQQSVPIDFLVNNVAVKFSSHSNYRRQFCT